MRGFYRFRHRPRVPAPDQPCDVTFLAVNRDTQVGKPIQQFCFRAGKVTAGPCAP